MADPRSSHTRRPGGRRPGPRTRVDPARTVAYEVLRAVATQDAYANLLLPPRLRALGLTGRDASFATELVSGTLRRRGTYDAIVVAAAQRPLRKIDPAVLDVLRLGAHQLLAMRVPTHAAVATSVELVRSQVGQGATGFVNAVLRRVAEHPLDTWVRRVAPDPATDPRGFLAVSRSHPRWVVDQFVEALAATPGTGDVEAELDRLLVADNEPPRVTLVARPGLSDREELLAGEAAPTAYSPWGAVLAGGDPGLVPAVAEGRAAVQDEGSQLVAAALLAAEVDGADERWLDMCAGPGGKAGLLAAVARTRGARLLAVERQPHRAELVRRTVAAVPAGTVQVVSADATRPVWPSAGFDRVLLDAPCTGLGALRRRPESRWRRSPADLEALVPLQQELLRAALDAVRPGGVVAYVTCSPALAETRDVVSAALAARDDVRLEDAAALLPQVPAAGGPLPGTVQLWPHRHGTDAMFLALLRRL